ncbi:MAG: SDR family oxidoreductase [Pseudomonadota bacterium]
MASLIITGASSGIGLATAQRFASADYRVVNLSRRPCPETSVHNLACDLTDPDARSAAVAELTSLIGPSEVVHLVHNAALLRGGTTADISDDDLREVIELNVIAPTALNRGLLPHMAAGSSILYVGSTLSEKAVPGNYSYVTTKHANIGQMRSTCQDLAGSKIHTACVCPGFTDTEMLRAHVPGDALESIAAASTFGRLVEPKEIAETLWFAAHAPVVNGAVIHANLGQIES